MSAATVTYHELPPMSTWASETVLGQNPMTNGATLSSFFDPNHGSQILVDSPSSWAGFGSDGESSCLRSVILFSDSVAKF